MLEVPSRPGSVRNLDEEGSSAVSDTDGSDRDESDVEGEEDEEEGDENVEGAPFRDKSDTRSIRSFSSMMTRETPEEKKERMTLAARLAAMPALSLSRLTGGTPPGSRRASMQPPARGEGTLSSAIQVPMDLRLAPPRARFLECTDSELRVGEIPALLDEYRRVVAGLRALGGFSE